MEKQKRKVAIIGAGVSGMVAAIELSDRCDVHLYEATDKLGGRATTLVDRTTGETIDNGQHICIGAYHRFLNFLKTINSDDNFIILDKYDIPYIYNGKKGTLQSKIFDGKFGLLETIVRNKDLSFIEKINTIIFALKVQMDAISFQRYSDCYELLKKNKQSEKVIKILWEPLIVSTMNTPIYKASPLIFENIMFDGFLSKGRNASFYLPKVDFGRLFSGFSSHFVKDENKIFFNSPIKLIEKKAEFFKVGEEYYNDVVITTPSFITNRLLEGMKIDINVPEYSPIVSIYVWAREKLFDKPMYSTVGYSFDWIFNRDNLTNRNKSNYSYQLTKSNALEFSKMNDDKIIEIVQNDLDKIFEKKVAIESYRIVRELKATFLADKKNVALRPKTKTHIKGLYLAGDFVSNGYPSTLEGAAINGHSAARHILKHI